MKTRRISAHRIGTERKSRRQEPPLGFLFALAAILILLAQAYYYVARILPAKTESIVQITVIATASPLPTATATPPPTLMPSPTPSPVIAPSPVPVFGVALGDVWLRKTAGGERLPAALLRGQQVEILESDGAYLKVRWSDGETTLTGWATAEWIEVQ